MTAALRVATADEMRALGAALGRVLAVGDVVGLVGPLGSGKTTFAQGVAEGMGIAPERRVVSPTFALVNEHPGPVPLVHADLYRLRNQAELQELGLDEAFDRAAALLEWLDLFPHAAPADHLVVYVAITPDGSRSLTATAHGARARVLAAALGLTG